MKFKFKFLVFYSLSFFILNAKIVESDDLNDVFKYISSDNPLILFDVDKTLIKYPENILSRIDQMHLSFPDLKSDKFRLKWFFAEPTQSDIKSIIDKLQEKYKVLVLTKCTNLNPFYKFYQMNSLGLDFSKSYPEFNFIDLSGSNGKSFYKDGVIICGNNNKGQVLTNFLKNTGLKFTEIVFIDDGLNKLQSVEEYLKKLNIPYTGIHYNRVKKG